MRYRKTTRIVIANVTEHFLLTYLILHKTLRGRDTFITVLPKGKLTG